MINVLFVTSGLGLGGAERQLIQIVRALNYQEFNVAILCLSISKGDNLSFCRENIETLQINAKSVFSAPKNIFKVVKFLAYFRADLLQGWMYGGNVVASILATILFRPVLHGIRASNMDDGRYSTQIFLNSILSRYSKYVIYNSYAGREFHLNSGFSIDNHKVITNGIDAEKFFISRGIGRSFREKLGIQPDTWLFLYAARVDPMKSHSEIINLAFHFPQVKFLFVGAGTDQLDVPANVIALGSSNEMLALYNAADHLISVSKYGEGFPNVIGEAMACGLNVIANKVGDSATILGGCGLVIDDRLDLFDSIGSIVSRQRRENINEGARKRIKHHYSNKKMVSKYEELFRSVIP